MREPYTSQKSLQLSVRHGLNLFLMGLSLLLWLGIDPAHCATAPKPETLTLTLSIKELTACIDVPFTYPYRPFFEAMWQQGGCPDCGRWCRAQMHMVMGSELEAAFVSVERLSELDAENRVCDVLEVIFGRNSEPTACNVADEPVECMLRRQ